MAEDMDVVKQLRRGGITSLFTNPFLQNMRDTFEKCLDRFSREIKKEPRARRHIVMILLGYLNFKVGKCVEAIKCFETVLKEDPNNINSLLHLLYVYKLMKLPEEAEQYKQNLEEILRNDLLEVKSRACAKYELAGIMSAVDAQLQPGGIPVTRRLFQEAINCNEVPENDKLLWFFAYAFFCLQADSAYGETQPEHFEEAMKYFYQVVTLEQPAPSEDSEEYAKQNMDFNDAIPKAWCFMGTLLSRHGRYEKFEKLGNVIDCTKGCFSEFTLHHCIEEAIEKANQENRAVIMRRAGNLYMNMGSMADAGDYLKDAQALDRENGFVHNLQGRWNLEAYKIKKDPNYLKVAINCFNDAIEKGFDLWHCYLNFAEAHLLSGNYDDAIKCCQQLEKHRPDSGRYDENYDVGVVYNDDGVGEVAAIINDLEKLLRLRCFFLDQDISCEANTVETLGKLDKSCHCILILYSDNFFPHSPTAYHTLTSVISDRCSNRKDTIIPARLPGCTVIPDALKSLRVFEVDGSTEVIKEIIKIKLGKRD